MFEAYSYAYKNVSNKVIKFQKQVFDKFNLPITQIIGDLDHGQFLEQTLRTCSKKYVIFFDVDCIPLASNLYDIILNELETEKCILGIEQTGNPRYHIYAGPACLALPTTIYPEFNYPTLNQTHRSDVAEELSWICEERAIKVKYFKVSHVEVPKWRLGYDRMFGVGTTYSFNNQNILYHQFEIRYTTELFIEKCKAVLAS
jgi:hypothetical protein